MKRALLTTTLCLGAALNPLNSTMIATALSPIGDDFGVGAVDIAGLVSVLYLASAIAQPLAGRLADKFGGRLVFATGSALVAVAGLVGALAVSMALLVTSRVLIGVGTALIYPAAVSVVREVAERPGMPSPSGQLRAVNMAALVALTIGPLLGGILVDTVGWSAVFGANVPLAAVALVAGLLCLPKNPSSRRERPSWRMMDVPGVLLFGAVLMIFQVLVATLPRHPYVLALALGGAALMLVAWELRADDPFIDFRMLASNPALVGTYLRIVLTFVVTYGVIFGVTPWLQEGRGLSGSAAGLLVFVMSAFAIVASVMGTWGSRPFWVLLVTALFLLAGSLAAVPLVGTSPIFYIGFTMSLFGVANGMAQVANQVMVYRASPAAQVAASAGLSRTAQYVGAMTATGAIALAHSPGPQDRDIERLALIFVSVSALLVILTVIDPALRRFAE